MDRKNKANKQHVKVGTDASARIQRSGYTQCLYNEQLSGQ